ncbi:30S ribosomal protein S16 [Mycoplasmopsis synoviae]
MFRPVYKIVVADARAPRHGKFIVALGHYNPSNKDFVLDNEKTTKWLANDAKTTVTVWNLFKNNKLTESLKGKK